MAKYVSPFAQLAAGKSSSSQGYSSPFLGLTSSGVTQHRKQLAKDEQNAQIKAQAQAALDAKNAENKKSFFNKAVGAVNAFGEGFGSELAKGLVSLGHDVVNVPTLTRFAKPVLPSSADKFIENKIVKPTRSFSDRVITPNAKQLRADQSITRENPTAARVGQVAGEGTTMLAEAVAPTPKVTAFLTRGNDALDTARAHALLNAARNSNNVGSVAMRGANRITDPARLLGTPESNASSRLIQIDKELKSLSKGAGSTFTPEAKSVAKGNLGTDTKLTPAQFEKNRTAGNITVAKGKTATFSPESGTFSSDATKQKWNALLEERKAILQRTQNPYKETTSTSKIASDTSVTPPKDIPKTPHNAPEANFFQKDQAETLRSRLTNQMISTTGLLSRFGKEGKALAGRVNAYNQTARDLSTEWFNRLPTYKTLNKAETVNFARAAQGTEDAMNAKVAKAVSEWKQVAPEIRQQFVHHSGEDIGNIQNFFPHTIKPEYMKRGSKGFNQAVKHLVDTGQVKTPGEAVNVLNFARRANTKGNVLGSFRFSRDFQLPEHMYDTSKTAIANYLEGAAHSVAGAQHLGMDRNGIFHTANDLIGSVASRGGNADKVKKTFEQSMGLAQHSEAATKVSNVVRSVQTFTKLGLGAITNAGQTVNTIIKNGFIDTAKGLGYLATPQGRQFARETGAFTHGLISDLREMRGLQGAAGKVGAPFFNNVEQFNRYLAATSGKFHAERLARRGGKYATEQLKKSYNVEGAIGKKLTREQQLRAGRASSDITQFIVAPHTLPGWATSPTGKLVSQFQTFSYKQSGFVWNQIIKPLNQGNVLPLVRLLAVLPAGYGIYRTKAAITGKDTSGDSAAAKVIAAWNAAGGGGTPQNLITGTLDAKKYSSSGKEFAANETANLGGVTAGTLMDTLSSAYGLSTGKPKAAEQQGLSLVPVVGQRLKRTYAPSGSQSGRDIKATPAVNKELNRLGYKLQDTNRKTGRAADLSNSDYNRFVDGSTRLFAQRATKALSDPQYQSLSEQDKKNTMSNILAQSRSDVLDLLVPQQPKSNTPKYKSYR